MEVGAGVHRRRIDTEEHHESPEEEIMRLIRKELGDQELIPSNTPDLIGCPSVLAGFGGGAKVGRLGRLTHYKNRAGDVTSFLAWDDLTGMRLEAGKVVEARAMEVTYLRETSTIRSIDRRR